MEELNKRYSQRAQQNRDNIARIKRSLDFAAVLRLVTFFALLGSLIYLLNNPPALFFALPVVLLVAFLVLVKRFELLQGKRNYFRAVVEVNEEELRRLAGDHSGLEDGRAFIDPEHPYTSDMDIYGPGSIFQYVNRTATDPGKARLAHWFANRTNNKTILERQEAVKELAAMNAFREAFRARAATVKEPKGVAGSLVDWVQQAPVFLSKAGMYVVLLWVLPLVSLSALIGAIFFSVPRELFVGLLILNLVISGNKHKDVSGLQEQTERQFARFRKYALLISEIEQQQFSSPINKALAQQFATDGKRASEHLNDLASILQRLDSLRNAFGWLILNGIAIWNIRYALKLEKWKATHASPLQEWLEALADLDALVSMGGYAYNNPDFAYPVPTDEFHYSAKNLAHPLLKRGERVANDLEVRNWGHFFLITGSNMAGKSTFLRSVGVNLVLAMAGAPVCASELSFAPVPMYSSMRIGDSIQARESTFYAELKRLRFIIEASKGEQIFIILDEILKGTNSKDKLTGSSALIEQLVKANSAGLIATHDLALADMETHYPKNLQNVHFDVQINVDKFHFDYKLKPGVCKTMNATQLMRNMGIELG